MTAPQNGGLHLYFCIIKYFSCFYYEKQHTILKNNYQTNPKILKLQQNFVQNTANGGSSMPQTQTLSTRPNLFIYPLKTKNSSHRSN